MPADRHSLPDNELSSGMRLLRRIRRRLRSHRIRIWARARLRHRDAVIIDTETTDLFGEVIQISVIDLDGRTLLDTLVRAHATIVPAATAVHGLADADLAAAPRLHQVAAQLLQVTRDRQLLAYNAPYDREVLTRDLTAADIDPEHLGRADNWACLMRARAVVEGRSWAALSGPHRSLGDCEAALEVLHILARRPA